MQPSTLRWIVPVLALLAVLLFTQPAATQAIRAQIRAIDQARSSGAEHLNLPATASLDLVKTVGTDPNACANSDNITVAPGARVTYCYRVQNTGSETLTSHDLVDDKLGTIFTGLLYNLSPTASAFLTQTVTVQADVTNTATWTARTSLAVQTSDTDSATVHVTPPTLNLVKTVGTDPNACASTETIFVSPGTKVTYCYWVSNTGDHTLKVHTLEDDRLGVILNAFAYDLTPAASAFITQTATVQTSVTNLARWTAWTDSGAEASHSDPATVITGHLQYMPVVVKASPP